MDKPTDKCVLDVQIDRETGQLLALHDPRSDLPVVNFAPGAEIQINGRSVATRLQRVSEARGEHITQLTAYLPAAYGAGVALAIRRVISVGGIGSHTGRPDSAHIRYEIRRTPATDVHDLIDYIWPPPLEAPLDVQTVTVLAAPWKSFLPTTRMRALAIGGSGPRQHVSFEDGPLPDMVGHLQGGFRTAFPGQQTLAGAMYYEPADERFVWAIVRRPHTGGRILFSTERQAVEFWYFTRTAVHDELTTPAVSLFWGRGLPLSERILAEQFDLYEEPPAWWFNTVWFWLHPLWQRESGFSAMAEGARILMDNCGVTGFGILLHDIPWSGNDIDVGSPRPHPRLGGADGLRRALDVIRSRGGHTYAWISRHGHRPDSLDFRTSWQIRGIDGRPVRIRNRPDDGVFLDIINPADPSFQQYMMDWIEYYVRQLGITGLFWDSGFQPLPPDFGDKPYLRYPGQTSAAAAAFYERMYRFGKSLSDDFFMWAEGISADIPMNAFAVDMRRHGENGAHQLLYRMAHHGPRRLVWRSAWPHDVGSGFPFIDPFNDVGWDVSRRGYESVAQNPMNQWLCRTARERSFRGAVGVSDGASVWDEYLVACPSIKGPVTVPADLCRSEVLVPVLGGEAVRGKKCSEGVRFTLPRAGAYRME